LKINGIAVDLSELKDSSRANPWHAKFTCNDRVVDVLFYSDVDLPAHDWKHKMPPMLKEFLETVRCEEI
jgi:hypothetical protein